MKMKMKVKGLFLLSVSVEAAKDRNVAKTLLVVVLLLLARSPKWAISMTALRFVMETLTSTIYRLRGRQTVYY